jgi:hypothetical protein
MAKKTTARSKTDTPADPLAPPAAPARTRTRLKAAAANSDKTVANDTSAAGAISMASEPSEEDIRLRAYHRFLERGGSHGMDFEDWLEAKRDLNKK